MQRHLRDIVFDTRVLESWATYLPLVQRILNSAHHKSIGMTPTELVYGTTLDPNRGLLTPYTKPSRNLNEWILHQIHSQQTAIQVAVETQRDTDQHHIRTAYQQDKQTGKRFRHEPDYPVGSYVMIETEQGPTSKLHPRLKGPMLVVAKDKRGNKPSVYTCEDLVTHKLEDFLVKLVHPFKYDTNRIDPYRVALTDHHFFEVTAVLNHKFRGSGNSKSDLQLLVIWEDDDTPKWEPYTALQHVKVVHDYLIAHRMKRFILPQYK